VVDVGLGIPGALLGRVGVARRRVRAAAADRPPVVDALRLRHSRARSGTGCREKSLSVSLMVSSPSMDL
jgi:hypothetical protein